MARDRKKANEYAKRYRREQLRSDPEFRETLNAYSRKAGKKWRDSKRGNYRELNRKYNRKRWRDDPEFRLKKKAAECRRRKAIQIEAINHYGGKCYCCGETEPLLLSLDHIHGGGNEHRRKEVRGARLGEWARRNGWPPILRTACHSCNHGAYLNGGVCPHQTSEAKILENVEAEIKRLKAEKSKATRSR